MINNYVLNASRNLDAYIDELEKNSRDSVARVTSLIPVKDVDIVLYDNPGEAMENIGIGGYTPNDHLIFISLNPRIQNFEKNIQNNLGRTIAHELHHALRWKNPGYGNSLLEALITEGLADHFSYEAYRGELEKWDEALSDNELEKIAGIAKQEYYEETYSHEEWFFGANSKKLPKWAGYTLGFHLVDTYLKNHPDKKSSTLYSVKAEEFI